MSGAQLFQVFVDPRQADGIHHKKLIRDTETQLHLQGENLSLGLVRNLPLTSILLAVYSPFPSQTILLGLEEPQGRAMGVERRGWFSWVRPSFSRHSSGREQSLLMTWGEENKSSRAMMSQTSPFTPTLLPIHPVHSLRWDEQSRPCQGAAFGRAFLELWNCKQGSAEPAGHKLFACPRVSLPTTAQSQLQVPKEGATPSAKPGGRAAPVPTRHSHLPSFPMAIPVPTRQRTIPMACCSSPASRFSRERDAARMQL